jgi:hypothetical protein
LVHNCPWPHQVDAILALESSLEESQNSMEDLIDVLMDKSRAQGGSYIALGVGLKHWLFDPMFSQSLISRNMDCVDNARDPDSLMYKLDFLIQNLPWWMRPKDFVWKRDRSISEHSWTNREMASTAVGYAASGDVGSGGRKSNCLFDEVAKFDDQRPGMAQEALDSTAHTTNNRWLISTHKGDSGVYFDMVFGDTWEPVSEIHPWGGSGVFRNKSGGIKIVLDWRDNPSQNRLAYRFSHGQFFPERPEEAAEVAKYAKEMQKNGNWNRLQRRGFVKENQLRSRWYDRRCLQKGATPRSIAQELDRNPKGSVGKCFTMEVIEKAAKAHCKPPVWEGEAMVHDGQLHLVERLGGNLRLWFKPGLHNDPPAGKYCVAADISTGTGGEYAANSCLCGGDAATGEQVLEYVDSNITPSRLGRLAVAICEWLSDALLIWESAGPTGGGFKKEVMQEINYSNIYWRGKEDSFFDEKTRIPGWLNNRIEHKRELFERLEIAMDDGDFMPRSEDLIKECGGWEWKDPKTMIYKGTGHGDRAIAAGMCRIGMKELGCSLDKTKEEEETEVYEFHMAGRLARRQAAENRDEDDDLAGFRREKAGAW